MSVNERAAAQSAGGVEAAAGWYVLRDGKQYGPLPFSRLTEHFASGLLKGDDQVWSPVAQRWLTPAEVFTPPAAPEQPAPSSDLASPAALPDAAAPDAAPGTSPPRASPRRRGSAAIYAILIIVLVSLSLVSCLQFLDERNAKPIAFALDGTSENAIHLAVQIVETDLIHEHLRLYVTPRLSGTLADHSPRLPARDIELTLASTSGPHVLNIKRGHHLEPFDLEIPLSDGHIQLYPMDRYNAWIEAEATVAGTGDAGKPETVPVVIELNPRNHAMHVVPQLSQQSEAGDVVLQLKVSRLFPIVVFTWFMAGVASMLAVTVVLVVVTVLNGRRAPELGQLGWFTALLFALPAVRNNLPGAPPLGALIDYTAFFWAEALVGLSMLVIVALWFTSREPPG